MWLTYPIVQFLLEQLVLLEEQRVRLLSRAKLRRQLIAFALHPVQLDAQRLAQLFVRRCVRLKGGAVSLRPVVQIQQPGMFCSRTSRECQVFFNFAVSLTRGMLF